MSRAVTRSAVGTNWTSTGSALAVTVPVPKPTDLVLVALYTKSATALWTTVSLGAGTFTQLHRQVGAASSLELWAGYGFAAGETDAALDTVLDTASISRIVHASYFTNGAVHGLPTLSVVGASATGTAVDPTSRTPTAADETQLSYVVGAHTHTTAPSAYTQSPGGMEAHAVGVQAGTLAYLWTQRRAPTSLSAHNVMATITSAEWVAINALITPTAPVAHATNHVYKGRAKKSLDTAGAA